MLMKRYLIPHFHHFLLSLVLHLGDRCTRTPNNTQSQRNKQTRQGPSEEQDHREMSDTMRGFRYCCRIISRDFVGTSNKKHYTLGAPPRLGNKSKMDSHSTAHSQKETTRNNASPDFHFERNT